MPQPNQPQYDYGEELQIIIDMGSSEYHALAALCIFDGTTRGMISVAELYKDAKIPASNIKNSEKVDSKF